MAAVSIYCSFGGFSDDQFWDGPGPFIYRRSHVIPNPDDPRGGYFDLGYIPGFIRRHGRDDDVGGIEDIWPYLRVSLTGGGDEPDTVVLDVDQVAQLRDDLTWWLDRVKREPRT